MVLIVEHRQRQEPHEVAETTSRSTERALRHMHWHFVPADASPLLLRRLYPLPSPPTAQEAP